MSGDPAGYFSQMQFLTILEPPENWPRSLTGSCPYDIPITRGDLRSESSSSFSRGSSSTNRGPSDWIRSKNVKLTLAGGVS